MMMNEMKAYRCGCCDHCLTVGPVVDNDDIVEFGEHALTIQTWDAAGGRKPNLWWRLMMALKMMVHGDLHGDHVILNKDDCFDLGVELLRISKEMK